MKNIKLNGEITQHYTFKEVAGSIFDNRKYINLNLVTPSSCGVGKFVTIGNGVRFRVAFIKSPKLNYVEDLEKFFSIPKTPDQPTVFDYNHTLGGYLYAFLNPEKYV
jgi:hypothetical protein